jgi:hypothetical protein
MSETFKQSRKEAAASVEGDAKALLADHYDVAPSRVVCVESENAGRYDTREVDATHLLDFAAVDWLIDSRPAVIPIAQRITPADGPGRFSLRVANGSNVGRCERAVLESDGVTPDAYLFGWRDGSELSRAWLLDVPATLRAFNQLEPETKPNGDGTAAKYLSVGRLVEHEAVKTGWEL